MDVRSAVEGAARHPAATVARVAWIALPFLLAPALDDALAGASRPVRVLASVLWVVWGCGLVALLIRRPASLTTIRILAPCGVVVGIAGLLTAGTPRGLAVAAVATAALATIAVLLPTFGDRWVDGASYGDERRFLLRPPAVVLLLVPVAWAVLVAAVTTGPLLLAARQWLAGVVVTAVSAPVVVVAVRALDGLSRRWAVIVPAGLVLHDPSAVADPFLCRRADTEFLGPALEGQRLDGDGDADLTSSAPGLVLTIGLRGAVDITVRHRGRAATIEPARRVHFVPSRPGALLTEAAGRRFPVR